MIRRLALCLGVLVLGCGDDAGGLPDGADPDLSTRGSCAEATGTGTDHGGTISAAETWTAAGSPHRITAELVVRATVTIEPCALVLLATDVKVWIGSATATGSIVAAPALGSAASAISAR
jgi:hypothetical protein